MPMTHDKGFQNNYSHTEAALQKKVEMLEKQVAFLMDQVAKLEREKEELRDRYDPDHSNYAKGC